jgi:hypothetical protein
MDHSISISVTSVTSVTLTSMALSRLSGTYASSLPMMSIASGGAEGLKMLPHG